MPTFGGIGFGGGGGLKFAKFNEASSSGATFSTLTNPNGDGKNYRLASFTSTSGGTLVIAESGLAEILVCGGGGGGGQWNDRYAAGAGGGVREGIKNLNAASYQVQVGAGGAGGGTNGSDGGVSNLGIIYWATGGGAGTTADNQRFGRGGGGAMGSHTDGGGTWNSGGAGWGYVENGSTIPNAPTGLNPQPSGAGSGITSSITGTSYEYGIGGQRGVGASLYGQGGNAPGSGAQGVVYVRVQI